MSAPAELVAALPQYEIGAEIGEGGMGVVFAGVHRTLGRSVAIKQLPWDVLNHTASSELFDREARVLASLDHPHIVPVYDYVRTGREHLLVMERLDGGTVHSRFHDGGVGAEEACAIGLATLAGLHAAHRAGVLHLDVKPRNLLFSAQGVMKVADFGIARVISEGATLVTHGGEVLGTPAYIAPEQAMGNALSPAADVYAAGTVLYELLSGRLPFDNTRGAISMMRQHMFTDPKPISGVPAPIAAVIMRSLSRELDARYREAESFAADLATAATTVFGPGWLERSGVPVLHLTPRVIAGLNAAKEDRPSHPDRAAWPTDPAATRPGRPDSPSTAVWPTGTAAAPSHPDRAARSADPATPPPAWPTDPARPQPTRPVNLPQIPEPRTAVIGLRVAAALAGLAVVLLALLTPDRLPHETNRLTLGGAPASPVVEADLSKPLVLGGPGTPGRVHLDLSAAGIPLGSADADARPSGSGFTAQLVLPGIARWIVGGAVTATVRTDTGRQTFTLLTSQHPLASAMGAGSLILALFALAYLESGLRTIRNGHRWRGAPIAGPLLGVLFGAAVWLCLSVLRVHEPSPAFGAGCAVAGAVAAGCLVFATRPQRRVSRPSGP